MGEAVLAITQTMGWLGLVLLILVVVNTVCGVIKNISEGQKFSLKTLFKGIGKAFVFYACSVLLAISFTMLPFINEMISEQCGFELISEQTLAILSNVAVLGIVINAIVTQGKKAIEGIKELVDIPVVKHLYWNDDEDNEEYGFEENNDEEELEDYPSSL